MATKENLVNYYGGKELAESFRTVRKNTLAVAQDIPEEKYSFRVAPETRSVGEMLTHIALAPTFQKKIHGEDRRTTLEGFDFPALMQRMHAEEKTSRTKAQVIELLTMPAGATPAARTRFDMILSVKEHEMHHRAQLMLIERIVGIVPHLTRRMQERMNAAAAKK
jgi:uncharacterized damage-inducible protein DinB